MEFRRPLPAIMAAMILIIPAAFATAGDTQRELFGPTEALREQARQAGAALLSPNAWLKGNSYLDEAREDFSRGGKPDRIRKRLAKAGERFVAARDTAGAAGDALGPSIENRRAAQQAEAARLAAGDWSTAEKTFSAAVKAFENGKLETAQRKNEEATALFDTAELNALRALVLAEARRLTAEVRRQKHDGYVPRTLGRAERLVKQADDLIVTDRDALEEPIALAARAIYEARHALYIAALADRIEREDMSVEALILDWETALDGIAAAGGIAPDFSAGPETTGAEVIALLEELPGLRSDLADRDALIADLEDEIRELDAALGGASADRTDLIRRLEQQARVREQFHQVENMFADSEAIVLREGNRLIIRLVGLNFASNSAKLGTTDAALLAKVQSAIEVFPQSALAIEGHTDATGEAGRNMALSEERAQAVKAHMTDVMRIPAFRISATGFGDTRPIASNKTGEGRARNRRIDLIIDTGSTF